MAHQWCALPHTMDESDEAGVARGELSRPVSIELPQHLDFAPTQPERLSLPLGEPLRSLLRLPLRGSEGAKSRPTAYLFAGVCDDDARFRPPLPAAFFPLEVLPPAAGPLAFFRALRLACSAVFPSPA
jgi:hypothetical protein